MLDILRALSFVAWMIPAIWLFPAATRYQFNRNQDSFVSDDRWALLWLVSVLLAAWGIRNVTGAPDLQGSQAIITCGLHTLQTLVAIAVIWRRYQRGGLTW